MPVRDLKLHCPVCKEEMVIADTKEQIFEESNERVVTQYCECMTCEDLLGVTVSLAEFVK